jgi:hypothetical protein
MPCHGIRAAVTCRSRRVHVRYQDTDEAITRPDR